MSNTKNNAKARAILHMLKARLREAKKASRERYLREPGHETDRYYRAGGAAELDLAVELAERILKNLAID